MVVCLLVPRRRLGGVRGGGPILFRWARVTGGAAEHLHAQMRGGGGQWANITVEQGQDLVPGDVAQKGAGLQAAHVELVPTLQDLGPVPVWVGGGGGKGSEDRTSGSSDKDGKREGKIAHHTSSFTPSPHVFFKNNIEPLTGRPHHGSKRRAAA